MRLGRLLAILEHRIGIRLPNEVTLHQLVGLDELDGEKALLLLLLEGGRLHRTMRHQVQIQQHLTRLNILKIS